MFTGRRLDTETGLHYYRYRYYSADLGRFISTDPIGYFSGMNLYKYVGNNPLVWVDPFGWSKDREEEAGYIDWNVTAGALGGLTAGMTFGWEGISWYGGGGAVTPGMSGSLTWSESQQTTGLNVAGQVAYGPAVQRGYTFATFADEESGWFSEAGVGVPGASVTVYFNYVVPWRDVGRFLWEMLTNDDS